MYNFEKSPKCTQYLLAEVWCLWYLLGPSFGIGEKKTPHISNHINSVGIYSN